jgi:hypothetical protein
MGDYKVPNVISVATIGGDALRGIPSSFGAVPMIFYSSHRYLSQRVFTSANDRQINDEETTTRTSGQCQVKNLLVIRSISGRKSA